MIDPARRARLLCGFEQSKIPEIHAPVFARALFRQRTRGFAIERKTARVRRHEELGHFPRESQRRAVGTETHHRFGDFAGLEEADLPPERREHVARDERGERGFATTFELDVVLRVLVVGESRGGARACGRETEANGNVLGLGDGFRTPELDVEVEQRNGERKQPPREDQRRHGREGVDGPERGPAGQGDGCHSTEATVTLRAHLYHVARSKRSDRVF